MSENILIKHFKTPIFRKIFRHGHYFLCGICRTEYHNRVDANNCLNHCWYALKEQYPLIVVRDFVHGRLFRCQYCFRLYKTEDAGLECARRCTDGREKRHVQEQLASDLPISVKPRRKFRLVKMVPQEETLQAAPAPTPQAPPPPEPEPEIPEEPAVKEPTIIKRHKSEFPKNWIRDGAKYKCKFCNELYYTKVEVEKCFNDHFDAQGYEKLE
ncbi:hypothetical protein [Pseudobacteriovorax antillogorgiicola]|uniref:Uncharacterized protein n=1 Tax=Pseudobacteriovorax antillogorgiicola TaxID=1513793 RepID=A0A1Y6BX50_9BACT|nr:hypothetical protein [Pseudobacteriovorax antillogorgiicola]TCS50291.1 hypothetical protein EDD56_113109 [Pseudobacteriovorax antillogorgiicola]SMF33904.1 hypothetical protein SAMN06296036_110108 [Pseudobacteriovorax antillogorgiicola]